MDEKLMADLEEKISSVNDTVLMLDRLYYHPDFGTIRTRPIISMMITGAKYLRDNLEVLKKMYIDRTGG